MGNTLPTLDQLAVASPCHVNWNDMAGDERARFCRQCQLHVYDISALTREEAMTFVREREGRTCVRFYRRQDGTILTRDCPVGLRAVRQRLTRAVAALAGIFVALIGGTLFGGLANRLKPGGYQSPSETLANWVDPKPDLEELWMGVMACPQPPTPTGGIVPGGFFAEPAETPLPPPTAEQLELIEERLSQ